MVDYNLEKRSYVIGGVAIVIVIVYIIRLFTLQIMSEDYKKNADSNAFLKQIEFPSRGAIYDRNGKLMVYNQPSYDLMVVMKEQEGRLDTLDFCNSWVLPRRLSRSEWRISRTAVRIRDIPDIRSSFS